MTLSAKSYLEEAANSASLGKGLSESLDVFIQSFLEIVNRSHPADLPLIVVALKSVTRCIEDSELYRQSGAMKIEHKISKRIKPAFALRQVSIPRTVIDMLERRGEG